MSVYNYNANLPNPPDDPADDVSGMQVNSASINSLIGVDHIGFNIPKGGIHNQVRMPNRVSAPGLGDGDGAFWASLINANSWPAWQNSAGNTSIVSYITSAVAAGGYCSLPGGLLLQWGIGTTTGTNTVINFPVQFTLNSVASNAFVVLCTPRSAQLSGALFTASNYSSTSFTYSRTAIPNYDFSWIAIGNKT